MTTPLEMYHIVESMSFAAFRCVSPGFRVGCYRKLSDLSPKLEFLSKVFLLLEVNRNTEKVYY